MPTNPVLSKTIKYLKGNIDNGIWPQGSKIPPYRELASSIGVSTVTMLRALAVLKKERSVSSRWGAGVFVGKLSNVEVAPKKPAKQLKSASIAEQIKADLLNGSLTNSEHVPQIKELMARYKTGFAIVKKALAKLLSEKLITTEARHYRINISPIKRTYNRIYFITDNRLRNTEMYGWEISSFDTFCRTLEKECGIRNIQLVKESFDSILLRKDLSEALGFIVWQPIDYPVAGPPILSTLTTLMTFGKPLSVIVQDQEKKSEINNLVARNKKTFFFESVDNFVAGFELGRHLFSKGHRKVCYFGYSREQKFIVDVFDGLSKAFALYNLPNAVTQYYSIDCPEPPTGLSSDEMTYLTRIAQEGTFLHDYQYQLTSTKMDYILPSHPKKIGLIMQETTMALYGYSRMFPNFCKALKESPATAWVGGDYYFLNFAVMDFLSSKNIKTPQQIGIAGISDYLDASLHNLTTYSFNYSSIAQSALNAIIYPELARRVKEKNKNNIMTIPGFIIDRGSA